MNFSCTASSPAHHNLNNQQLKLFLPRNKVAGCIPAHHNLNNQQLKQYLLFWGKIRLTSTS
ncbi:hypothetical protein BSPWISOX_2255 [uncultured Gammaproteobacteria bacterium]|nr:hypothetical protein BSPWISOX_2255 [uncultured Gammaproteobacteria bacterium]